MRWSAEFDEPILIARGKPLRTLSAARDHILKLPKAEQAKEPWQAATEAVIMAAENRGPMMHAHIGMNRAVNGVTNDWKPTRGAKSTHWTRPKAKRDR